MTDARKGANMANDVFVAFVSGGCAGLILGMVIAAIFKVMADTIERGEKE